MHLNELFSLVGIRSWTVLGYHFKRLSVHEKFRIPTWTLNWGNIFFKYCSWLLPNFLFYFNCIVFRLHQVIAMAASQLGRAVHIVLVFLFIGILSVNCNQISKCKHVLISDSGTLSSLKYSIGSFHHSHCSWLIVATQAISFTINNFDFKQKDSTATVCQFGRQFTF